MGLPGEWMRLMVETIRHAQADDEINAEEDAEQLAFELTGYLLLGNTQFVVTQKKAATNRARRAVGWRVVQATAR